MTPAYISLLPLHLTFSVLLMRTLHWKFLVFSLFYLKHSIGFSMVFSFINSRVMELMVTSLNVLNRFQTTGVNELFSMVNRQSGNPLQLVYRKVRLIYINDFPLGLTTNVKLFADDTLLFSVVNNASVSASRLNNDLVKIQDWAFNWKMSFNPDPTKQVKEVIFSKKHFFWYPYFSTIQLFTN